MMPATAAKGGRAIATHSPLPLTAAVVGLGSIAFEHLDRIAAMGARIVGVCDVSSTLARAVADRVGAERPFTDYREMLADIRPDVVHVLTPPVSHQQLAIQALEAGAHVFVEKPITATWQEYVELREVARASGRLLCENYNYRFTDVLLRGLELWQSGAIGEVVSVRASFGGVMGPGAYTDADVPHFAHGMPGGALQNFVSHPVSLVLPFLGPCHGACAWQRRVGDKAMGNDELRVLLAGDRAAGLVAVTANERPSAFSLSVHGSLASMQIDLYNRRLELHAASSASADLLQAGAARLRDSAQLLARRVSGRRDSYQGLTTLLARFYCAASGGTEPPVSLEEMDAVNEVVHRVFDPALQL